MGKLDGMDPKLVRELLAEVGRAGKQMRTVESRITRLTSGAGLPVPATHRPVQVADAGDTLVRDVTARLVLLEKKEKQKDPVTGPQTMKQSKPDKQDSKFESDKSDKSDKADKHHPPKGESQDKTESQDKPHAENTDKDDAPKAEKPDKDDGPKAEKPDKDDTPKAEKPDKVDPTPKADKPEMYVPPAGPDDTPTTDPTDRYEVPRTDTSDPVPKADPAPTGGTPPTVGPAPTGDAVPTENPAPTGDSAPTGYAAPTGDSVPDGRLDTPDADNSSDIDTTRERTRVIEVDGVRVVEVTMKPPSAEYLRWLMENMDKIPPMDQPVIVPPEGAQPGNPHADGPVGYVQPGEPSGSAKPSAPLPPDSGVTGAEPAVAAPLRAVGSLDHVQPGSFSPDKDTSRYGLHSGGGEDTGDGAYADRDGGDVTQGPIPPSGS